MDTVKLFALIGCIAVLAACTYTATVGVTPAYDVYSNHETKVPGTWALFVDVDRLRERSDVVGIGCSAHKYPLDVADAFRPSAAATIGNLVQSVQLVDSPLSATSLEEAGYAGQIVLKSEELSADLTVIPGFWSAEIEGDVEMAVSMIVDGRDGRLLGTTVTGEDEVRVRGGCPAGGQAIGKAAEGAIRRTLATIGERLSNSPRVRGYAF